MYKREPQTVACVAGDFVWLIEQANRRQGTGNVGFFCSVNHLSGRLRKKMLSCDWCISIHFVCFCVSRFAACDRILEQYRVSLKFVFAGQAGWVRCIVICIKSLSLKWLTEQKNPFEVWKHAVRYNAFDYNRPGGLLLYLYERMDTQNNSRFPDLFIHLLSNVNFFHIFDLRKHFFVTSGALRAALAKEMW